MYSINKSDITATIIDISIFEKLQFRDFAFGSMFNYRSASKIWREAARPKGTSNSPKAQNSKSTVTNLKPDGQDTKKADNLTKMNTENVSKIVDAIKEGFNDLRGDLNKGINDLRADMKLLNERMDEVVQKLDKIDKKLPQMPSSSTQRSPSSEKEEKKGSELQPQQINPGNMNKEMPLILGSESGSNKTEISSGGHSQKSQLLQKSHHQ